MADREKLLYLWDRFRDKALGYGDNPCSADDCDEFERELIAMADARGHLRSRNEELEAEVNRLRESRSALMDAYGAAVFELQRLGVKTVPLTPPPDGEPCPECDGKEGQLDEDGEPCDLCWGRGYVRSEPAEGAGGDPNMIREARNMEVTPDHQDTAQRQDAMLGRREAHSNVSVLAEMARGEEYPIYPEQINELEASIRQALSRTSDEGGVPEAVMRLPGNWRKEANMDPRTYGRAINRTDQRWYDSRKYHLEACANQLDRAIEQSEHGEQRMVPVYAVPEDVEAHNETCFTLHDHPPFGADFLTLFRAALAQSEQGRVPEGWKLMPVEPTEDLLQTLSGWVVSGPDAARKLWARLVAATPHPEHSQPDSGEDQE